MIDWRFENSTRLINWASVTLVVALVGCGGPRDPVQTLSRDLSRYPEYSLMVEDIRIQDGFYPDYFLRFRMLTAAGQKVDGRDTLTYEDRVTNWYEVSEHVFGRYENFVGMVVASKTRDGRMTDVRQAHPPGYQYVGNPQYGSWGAGGFWQFYGQYALMSHLMGGWRVGRDDYTDYRRNHERGRAYYGPSERGRPAFGSRGSVTEKTRPAFYRRQNQRMQSGGRAFSNRVQSRMGRTSSGWGRGSGFRGK